jgi:hypothetical protein
MPTSTEDAVLRSIMRRCSAVADRANATHLPDAYDAMWATIMDDVDLLDDETTRRVYTHAVLYTIAADAAERISKTHRTLAGITKRQSPKGRRNMVADLTKHFEHALAFAVEAAVPVEQLDDEAREAEEARLDALSRIFASGGQKAKPTEPAEAPDAGKAPQEEAEAINDAIGDPAWQHRPAMYEALDRMRADVDATEPQPRVYRHDEHMPAGPTVTRIETDGEKG